MMELKYQIYPVLFLLFGFFEFCTNLFYLLNKNGLKLAARQHFELPPDASPKQLKTKVICMLVSGGMFLLAAVYCFSISATPIPAILLPLTLFTAYTFIEAMQYRRWGAFFMTGLSAVLLIYFIR